jgi:hypothetical protein
MRIFSRKKIAGAAAIAAFGAASFALAPAAHASSGGGCSSTAAGWVTVTACISASGATVYPDGYAGSWGIAGIPSGCHVYVQLLDGSNNTVQTRGWTCSSSQTHYGPFAWVGPRGSNWRSIVTVSTTFSGSVAAVSPVEHLSY